jgi:hypothetical protein
MEDLAAAWAQRKQSTIVETAITLEWGGEWSVADQTATAAVCKPRIYQYRVPNNVT